MASHLVDILIPTWNNYQYLDSCVRSILRVTGLMGDLARIVIINNGSDPYEKIYAGDNRIKVINAGSNLGWEGGLKLGLEQSDTEFVCFLNDDTFIPISSGVFFQRLLAHFLDPKVAITMPVTTTAAGCQSIFNRNCPGNYADVSWGIFFCAMLRRKYLDEVGGIDDTLPGGDDLDMSFRMRKAGYRVLVDPGAFIIHHGFVTGTRVRGNHMTPGGWNSPEMSEETNIALIRKHGFKFFFSSVCNQILGTNYFQEQDTEGNLIRSIVNGDINILELGCGAHKTVDKAIGIDRVPKGFPIQTLRGEASVADITHDVQEKLPFEDGSQDLVIARHILEHCMDTVAVLKDWSRVIKPGGRLILALPDERRNNTIPLNPEHLHAFSPATLQNLTSLLGLDLKQIIDPQNGISFIAEIVKLA